MLTVEKLKLKIRELAGKYPDASYRGYGKGCFYSRNKPNNGPDKEGCIVGQAIDELVPGLAEEMDEEGCSSWNNLDTLDYLHERFGSDFTNNWISCVQYHQDCGEPWKKCIELADKEFK